MADYDVKYLEKLYNLRRIYLSYKKKERPDFNIVYNKIKGIKEEKRNLYSMHTVSFTPEEEEKFAKYI